MTIITILLALAVAMLLLLLYVSDKKQHERAINKQCKNGLIDKIFNYICK